MKFQIWAINALALLIANVMTIGGTSIVESKPQPESDAQFLSRVGVKVIADNTLAANSQPSKPCCHAT